MLCQSVLVAAAAMASLCFGMDVLHSQRQEPVCPSQHSCSSRGTSNASSHLECSCDARCREHGDCCRDSQYYSVDEQRRNVHEYVCVADTLAENHVYVKVKCAQDWNNTEVQALCMRGNTIQDTIHDVPVTSWFGDSYANAYCAVCNGEDPTDFRRWNVYMVGRGLRDASAFTPCRTHFVVPQNFRRDTRRCLPTVKTCSDARADQHDLSLCESYTAAVYHEDFIFRNQHCASCNGYKQSSCVQPTAAAALPPARPALTMLLSLENNHIDAVDTCSVWEVKDRSEECRPITCLQLNEEFRYSKCVSVQGKATLSTSELLCPFHHSCSLPEFIDIT
ncbi:hypothetical protein E2C01_067541 [Portunus trituberculatus]|uniref:SMB domain-containing protein n=1 Tax=Portunus trituberculatus TaxID=210409 RepID=A0A5B7HTW9_PORTR|nr:hypothetical protein [Portunus trituberculatus]